MQNRTDAATARTKRLAFRAPAAMAAVAVLLIAFFLFANWLAIEMKSANSRANVAAKTIAGPVIDLGQAAKEIEIDVIQVQQFMQDIASTRGLDGLDGGLDEAASFAEKFKVDVAKARELADGLGLAPVIEKLNAVETEFGPFYAVGQKMANAYVAGGPAMGNPMMSEFDAAADAMYGSIDSLMSDLEAFTAARIADFDRSAASSERQANLQTNVLLGGLAVILLLLGYVTRLVLKCVVKPLTGLAEITRAVAEGNDSVEVPQTTRKDEIGDMIKAVAIFRKNAIARTELESAQQKDLEVQAKRSEHLRALIGSFESSIGEVVTAIDSASDQMSQTAAMLTGIAGDTRGQTQSAATASTQASGNVQTVASAAEELATSISEIGQQLSRASAVVTNATAQASRTNSEVNDLAGAAQRIGEVVTLIQDIAEQTNLLALNATIEAARAGDMGKGFAVVASEVKALAQQTAKATEEIAVQIEGIQSSTTRAVCSIGEMSRIMDEVNAITESIASAVEEQASATDEISRNIQEAATGTDDVARNVEGLAGSVDQTANAARDVEQASQGMSERATALRDRVTDFLKSVAA